MIAPHDTRRGGSGRGNRSFFSAGAAVLLLSWLLVPTAPAAPGSGVECELTFEPTYVEVGNDSTTVRAIPSEEVGEFDNVTVDPDSGLEVSLIPDQHLHVLVDASEGEPGDWNLSLNHGEMSLCNGALRVRAPQR